MPNIYLDYSLKCINSKPTKGKAPQLEGTFVRREFSLKIERLITSIIKHKHIENAQDEIRYAKVALENLTRELQDVGDYITVDIEIDTFAKVTDYLLDNFVSDIYVQSKINNASQQVDDAIYETEKILNVLKNAQ